MVEDRSFDLAKWAPAIIWVTNEIGEIVFINKRWTELTGQSQADALGYGWLNHVYPEDRQFVESSFVKAFLLQEEYRVEYRVVAKTDEPRWIVDLGCPRFDEQGEFLGYVGSVTDIHETKSAEESLYNSNQRFLAAIEAVSGIMWICDAGGRFTSRQPGWERITGQTFREYEGLGWVSAIHPEEQESFLSKARYSLKTGEPFDTEVRVINPEHKWRPYTVKAIPVRNADRTVREWVGVHSDITDKLLQDSRLLHLSSHDALTNLPNRTLLIDRITTAVNQRKQAQHAVLFIDLNHFKVINDSLGHQIGDQLLVALASRLKLGTRRGDTICRFGGDEFVILLNNIEDAAAVAHAAIKILNRVAQPTELEGHELAVTASIGIAMFPQDGKDAHTLLQHAERAMYTAKSIAGGAFKFYTKSVNVGLKSRLELEGYLRKAISQEEFKLAYQPKVSIREGKVKCFEALLRWEHPIRGHIPPDQFIPLAEEIGLISDLSEWVLAQAFQQLKEFDRIGLSDLNVGVNLSVVQLSNPEFMNRILAIMDEAGVDARRIEFEITESRLMEDINEYEPVLNQLQMLGSSLTIDDFGTGYSSLAYLKKLPIETLKIDKSFVDDVLTDPEDAAIVTAIISMAHAMDLDLVAEGVESRDQVDYLARQGCDCFQGFVFGKPMFGDQLGPFLSQFRM
jgi:diguanylate cyclase (GGDEF)-like protein/PAS domain S-box-containing protein